MKLTNEELAVYLDATPTQVKESEDFLLWLIRKNFPCILNKIDAIQQISKTPFPEKLKMHLIACYVLTAYQTKEAGINIYETELKKP